MTIVQINIAINNGSYDEAYRLAKESGDTAVLKEAIIRLVYNGNGLYAFKCLELIPVKQLGVKFIKEIVKKLADNGNGLYAFKCLEVIPVGKRNIPFIQAMVTKLVDSGSYYTTDCLELIPVDKRNIPFIQAIAKRLVYNGNGQYAFKCLELIPVDKRDVKSIQDIATKLADKGNGRYAFKCLELIPVKQRDAATEELREQYLPARNAPQIHLATSFGIELEFFGYNDANRKVINRATLAAEIIQKGDSTIKPDDNSEGKEFASPIIKTPEQLNTYLRLVDKLKAEGCKVNQTCALHIHAGMDFKVADFKDAAGKPALPSHITDEQLQVAIIKNIIIAYAQTPLIPNMRNNDPNAKNADPTLLASLRAAKTLQDITKALDISNPRGHKFHAVGYRPGFGTLEFRQHQGTMDSGEIGNWVSTINRIVKTAKRDAVAELCKSSPATEPSANAVAVVAKLKEKYATQLHLERH
jgi:Putative amidoligase enzyme